MKHTVWMFWDWSGDSKVAIDQCFELIRLTTCLSVHVAGGGGGCHFASCQLLLL